MPPTPRVDATDYHSGQHSGRMVRVTGKLLSVEGDRAQLEMAGGGAPAAVVFNDASLAAEFDASLVGSGHFEVIGTLQGDATLQAAQVVNLGTNFDMGMYGEMLSVSKRFPHMFA
mmetsp:Transcript_31071/g.99368  ORF Transcript_31071/g.99368 Transcript_31071/m.99368 type:complete len:115 (-) Transcript_31071:278-622(-)